jgi:hypothetical protein
MENNASVRQVLKTSWGRAPEMTHSFSNLGGGDMGAGIRTLWNTGCWKGVIIGASVASLILSLENGVRKLLQNRQHKNTTSTT